ncbi:phage antirepressor KilAC domain-containing protein [Deinococcus sp. KNUC1210]|uniref:phage antirepressor KilAC domain-containing protein n=1 Tax=Deinococcus sp. KNUC1210 TaxID=2917691 RepID=UPI001EF14C18|nr:phage antirepressor KilAC domain-containing protein [Deinococcus sp. KNUC1210]ULH16010.1 phage antirepressor KilAC domain-containing protein [Deinococcus sp. KNUC1210]
MEAQVAVLAPKALVYDALISAYGTYSVGDAAKVKVLGTGEVRLFRTLRDRSILMDGARSGVEHHNVPYQRFIEAGYFTVITRPGLEARRNGSATPPA